MIDGVEFEGRRRQAGADVCRGLALHAGDVFNSRKARQALNALLRPTRGAIMAGRVAESSSVFTDTRQLGNADRRTFDLVEVDGKRILHVGLREPAGRFQAAARPLATAKTGLRRSMGSCRRSISAPRCSSTSDSITRSSPGISPSRERRESVGYALGFERPFFILSSALSRCGGLRPDRLRRSVARSPRPRRASPRSGRAAAIAITTAAAAASSMRRFECNRRSKRCSRCAASGTNPLQTESDFQPVERRRAVPAQSRCDRRSVERACHRRVVRQPPVRPRVARNAAIVAISSKSLFGSNLDDSKQPRGLSPLAD